MVICRSRDVASVEDVRIAIEIFLEFVRNQMTRISSREMFQA